MCIFVAGLTCCSIMWVDMQWQSCGATYMGLVGWRSTAKLWCCRISVMVVKQHVCMAM